MGSQTSLKTSQSGGLASPSTLPLHPPLRFHRIRVDGSRIRKEKAAFSNDNGYVRTGPKSICILIYLSEEEF